MGDPLGLTSGLANTLPDAQASPQPIPTSVSPPVKQSNDTGLTCEVL